MANRRMLSIEEMQSDNFLRMSVLAQYLYVQLSLSADDEGFVTRVRLCEGMINAGDKELNELIENHYIFKFDSGIYVIANWHVNNKIRSDRFHPTEHQNERKKLQISQNGWYKFKENSLPPIRNQNDPEVSLGKVNKDSSGNVSLGEFSLGELGKLNKYSKGESERETRNSENQHSQDIPEETIREVLIRNHNDVNSFVKELIDSGINLSDNTMKLIEKISSDLRNKEKQDSVNKTANKILKISNAN